jgi:hypothetical protein
VPHPDRGQAPQRSRPVTAAELARMDIAMPRRPPSAGHGRPGPGWRWRPLPPKRPGPGR